MTNDLVFTETMNIFDEPFTTAEVIAKYSGNGIKTVNNRINQYKSDLEEFGVLHFNRAKPAKGSKGGRPHKNYQLNEEQATLLITYLDNTKQVRRFKKELVRQFFAMKQELMQRQLFRGIGKADRLELTDAIKESDVLNSPHDYGNFTRLVYKTAIGYNASQLRKARGAKPKAVVRDFLTADELKAVSKREAQVTTLVELGMDYSQVKAVLTGKGVIYQTTLKLPVTAQ